jgi:hypothetical protein
MDGIDGDMLSMILKILGVKNIQASTDHPDAILTIHFERHGTIQRVKYRLGDLVDYIQGKRPASLPPGKAPDGYTDITSLG